MWKTTRQTTHLVLVDIIVHTASSSDSNVVSHLIKALGQRRKISGKEAYFIHVALSSLHSSRNN